MAKSSENRPWHTPAGGRLDESTMAAGGILKPLKHHCKQHGDGQLAVHTTGMTLRSGQRSGLGQAQRRSTQVPVHDTSVTIILGWLPFRDGSKSLKDTDLTIILGGA